MDKQKCEHKYVQQNYSLAVCPPIHVYKCETCGHERHIQETISNPIYSSSDLNSMGKNESKE